MTNWQAMKEAKNCKDYAEFVIFLYDIGALACKESEMERIVEALDEIDSGREY